MTIRDNRAKGRQSENGTALIAHLKPLSDHQVKILCGRRDCEGDVAIADAEDHSLEFREGFVQDTDGIFRLNRRAQRQWDHERAKNHVPWSRFAPSGRKAIQVRKPWRERYDGTGPDVQRVIDVQARSGAPRKTLATIMAFEFDCPVCDRRSVAQLCGERCVTHGEYIGQMAERQIPSESDAILT